MRRNDADESVAARARAAFLAWVDAAGGGGREFLQLWIRRTDDARYELRHVADRGTPLDRLAVSSDPRTAPSVARTTDSGRHRPLRSTPDLRRGWALLLARGAQLWDALDGLYPAAGVHWFQHRSGAAVASSFAETAARQTGIYAPVRALGGERLASAVRACCGRAVCLRSAVWHPALPLLDRRAPGGEAHDPDLRPAVVPCKEPCSIFLSFALEVPRAEAEIEILERIAPSPSARARLAEALRTAADHLAAEGYSPFETADFTRRMNPRRLRYWAERLRRAREGDEVEEDRPACATAGTPGEAERWRRGGTDDRAGERSGGCPTVAPHREEAILTALAACSAVEVAELLEARRAPALSLDFRLDATPAPGPPRRLQRVGLALRVATAAEPCLVERAVGPVLDGYRAVAATLAPGTGFGWTVETHAPAR